jgi:hypothetical protein
MTYDVILSGYAHNARGEFIYRVETEENEVDAMFAALAYAASDKEDFPGTVTARVTRTTKFSKR